MKIGIPNPNKKRALIIVDVQSSFLNDENKNVVPLVVRVLKDGDYSAIVEATFSSDGNPLWEKQTHWTCEPADTVEDIKKLLPNDDSILSVHKSSKSVWKGNADVKSFLQEKDIEEVHVVGLDTNDCVMATAYESFDLGFQTYVIEEATHASQGSDMRAAAIEIMKRLDLTNHSEYIKDFKFI